MDPTPSLLSFGEAIALVSQRLNVSSGRAAAVVREALKSHELRIIRDDHIDPSGRLGDHAASYAQAGSRAGKAGCD